MLLLWNLYWPVLAIGLALGTLAGLRAFRLPVGEDESKGASPGRSKRLAIPLAILVLLGATALWHGPLGAAGRLTAEIETFSRLVLDNFEMEKVEARLERGMLSRTLNLTGPADDFQRSELRLMLQNVPGVAAARWPQAGEGSAFPLPLLVEVELWSLVAFGLGLLLAYLIELRRRARAEWRW